MATAPAKELLLIETDDVTVVLKGKLDPSRHASATGEVAMGFSCNIDGAQLYDRATGQLAPYHEGMQPIFFENGMYELLILPQKGDRFQFEHEYDGFRQAVSKISRAEILTGTLHFRNEVGFSTMEIHKNGAPYLEFKIEVFPTKLDYQKDYKAMLDEVNAEIYNLAFSFIQRTHLNASRKQYKEPTQTEFFRLLKVHFDEYVQALGNIERFPHHQLITTHEVVRGDRLRKQDQRGRAYLRKNAQRFVDVAHGIQIGERTVLPEKGLLVRKQQTHDTHENRYVKWTMQRISARIGKLRETILHIHHKTAKETYAHVVATLEDMQQTLRAHLKRPLWQSVGKLDRSVQSLVLQMGTGYREVFQVYTILSQSLMLHGDLYKMSVKDIATLYEYWTFLKLGQILDRLLESTEQTIVQADYSGLYVNLQQNKSATRKFVQKETGEHIELRYQYNTGKSLPTVTQIPDTMLSIAKVGKNYSYQYVFDAKYRVDVTGNAGPQQDDINTMHRYRDAIVAEQNGYYERTSFGAYVLFPWNDEETYRQHALYKSIEKVNIGGLPFLPDHTTLVENILQQLLSRSAEDLQQQGILPIGTTRFTYNEQPEQLPVQAQAAEVQNYTEQYKPGK